MIETQRSWEFLLTIFFRNVEIDIACFYSSTQNQTTMRKWGHLNFTVGATKRRKRLLAFPKIKKSSITLISIEYIASLDNSQPTKCEWRSFYIVRNRLPI